MERFDFINGEVILINKPLRWTSFDVVNKIKWAVKKSGSGRGSSRALKIGHAGTLDPLATGLLILCTGKKTKEISAYQEQEKEYTGKFFLGATTPCFDLEQAPDRFFPVDHITEGMIMEAAKKFTGTILQSPPAHSAVMVDGKRAYKLARAGKSPEMKQKEITIKEFEITAVEMPYISFRVVCSKGTYIRSLANEFGEALGSGAFLAELCRTRVGKFLLNDASGIDELVETIATSSFQGNPAKG